MVWMLTEADASQVIETMKDDMARAKSYASEARQLKQPMTTRRTECFLWAELECGSPCIGSICDTEVAECPDPRSPVAPP